MFSWLSKDTRSGTRSTTPILIVFYFKKGSSTSEEFMKWIDPLCQFVFPLLLGHTVHTRSSFCSILRNSRVSYDWIGPGPSSPFRRNFFTVTTTQDFLLFVNRTVSHLQCRIRFSSRLRLPSPSSFISSVDPLVGPLIKSPYWHHSVLELSRCFYSETPSSGWLP